MFSISLSNSRLPDLVLSLNHYVFEIPYLAQFQDAYATAPGIPLDFHRTFPQDSAHAPYLGPFGRGWTHSFNLFLEEFTDGRIAFFGPDGFDRWFMSNGDGTYTPSPGDYGTLTRDPDGTFQLREKTGFIYRFRSDLRLDYMQDSNGNRVTCIYNENNEHGRISKLIDHVSRETTYEYSSDGIHLLKVTDPAGHVTSYIYSLGQGEATYHRLTSIAFPDGTHIYYTYDSEGRLKSMECDSGIGHITYSYDANGTTYITDATGSTTIIRVNEYGQPTEVVNPLGAVTRYEYDPNLNLVKVTDSLNHTYIFDYDERGNVIQITDPLGNSVKFGYEPNYNKIAWLQDSLGRITTYSYNLQGNLPNITYPDGSVERYIYDKDNRLKSKIDRNGRVINYTFDDRGLLLSKMYPDGTFVNYTYDALGRITSATNPTGTISFEYDESNNPIRVTYPGNRTFKYEYDAAGKRTRMIDPDGRVLNYEYDEAGRLVKIADDAGQTIVEYQYDDANRRIRKTLGNGAYTTYE